MKKIYIGAIFIIIISILIMMFVDGYNEARILLNRFDNNITLNEYFFINDEIDSIENPIKREEFSWCVWANSSYKDADAEAQVKIAQELVAKMRMR